MDWQHKAAALNALAKISIKCRAPGDWYVEQSVEIKDDGLMIGEYGNGETPEAAIEDHWKCLVQELGSKYLVANSGREDRRTARWNGFMWADVPEPKRDAKVNHADEHLSK